MILHIQKESGENMDKRGRRFLDDDEKKPKIIDLDESDVKEEFAAQEDIDTLYEANESKENKPVEEPTRVIEKVKPSKESKKEQKRQERLKEKNDKKLDKLMKKQQKRERKSDREVLSYEDMPLEARENAPENTHAEKSQKKLNKKKIVLAALIIVVLFGVVFVFANSDKLSWHNIRNYVKYGILNQKGDENFPISVQGENVDIGNFDRMGQDVCYTSDTKLEIINNYGRYEYSAQHGFTNPVLKSGNQYALIYSLGGVGYQVNNYEKTIFVGETEGRIVTGAVNDNGTYALVTTSDGYLSKMHVFNKENEKIFGYSFADYYVTSVSLAPNGKVAVVTGLSALNGAEISSIYVLDFTKDKPVYLEEVEDNIFYDVLYLNDTYACAVGNSAVSSINTKYGEVNTTRYEGKSLTCYCFNRDTATFSVSLSRSGDGRNCEIFSFSADGKVSDSFETEYMVKYISTYKGRVALLTPEALYLYSKSGDTISRKEVDNEPRAIVLYTTADAYVLDTNEISTLRF